MSLNKSSSPPSESSSFLFCDPPRSIPESTLTLLSWEKEINVYYNVLTKKFQKLLYKNGSSIAGALIVVLAVHL
jgi:hypothetical protein